MVKGVIFDMDGVLINSEPYYMELNLLFLHQLGGTDIVMKDLYPTVGSSIERTYEIFCDLLQKKYTFQEMDDIYMSFMEQHLIQYPNIMNPGVKETVQALWQQGIKIGVASSSPLDAIEQMLKECEMEPYFSSVLSGDQFEETKPHPEIYLKSAQKLGLQPAECLVVEDSPYGIEAGKRAGMYVVAIAEPFGQDQSQADTHIQEMKELLDIIAKKAN